MIDADLVIGESIRQGREEMKEELLKRLRKFQAVSEGPQSRYLEGYGQAIEDCIMIVEDVEV